MGYQFFHAYTFSTGGKHPAAGCLGEACREPEYSQHVKDPHPPEWIEGSRERIDRAIREYQEKWRDSRGHKLRVDGQILRADVVAWPADMSPEEKKRGQALTLKYYREKFGSAFRGALIHADEPFKDEELRDKPREHLHLFIVPESDQRFDDLHAGLKAKKNADQVNRKNSKEEKAEAKAHGSEAYRAAMKAEQDEFFERVGRPAGLQRKDTNSPRERISKQKQSIFNKAKDHAAEITDKAKEVAESIKADAERAAAGIRGSAEKEISELREKSAALKKQKEAQDKREAEYLEGRNTVIKKAKMPEPGEKERKKIPLVGEVFLPSYFERVKNWAAGLAVKLQQLVKENTEKQKALDEDKKEMRSILMRLDGKYGEAKEYEEWKAQREAERKAKKPVSGRGGR
jgi:hypothetical protein